MTNIKHMTIGEKYEPAMKIEDQAEADRYFEFLVGHTMGARPTTDRALAESIERQNLGYFAGYYDHATRERVEHLFNCAHPVFGSIAEKGLPSADEALSMLKAADESARTEGEG